jgi:hypothetical protein
LLTVAVQDQPKLLRFPAWVIGMKITISQNKTQITSMHESFQVLGGVLGWSDVSPLNFRRMNNLYYKL